MGKKERRRHPRVDIDDPISYLCVDSDGQQFAQNMGIARNVSQSGIFIETFAVVETEYIVLAFADLDNNITEIKGKVVYSQGNGFPDLFFQLIAAAEDMGIILSKAANPHQTVEHAAAFVSVNGPEFRPA